MPFGIWDALDRIGHPVERSEYQQQIRCPFHAGGDEVNLSARVYPETDTVFCFTCAQRWNPIALVAEAEGLEYGAAKRLILSVYGGWQPNKLRTAKLDAQLADIILTAPKLRDLRKRKAAEEAAHEILRLAASGEPPWEIEDQIRLWAKQFFPRLMQ